jgi:hypothetical protein
VPKGRDGWFHGREEEKREDGAEELHRATKAGWRGREG